MDEIHAYASGDWTVTEGKQDEFEERWKAFLGWTQESMPGFVSATLIRQVDDPRHYVSFGAWADEASQEAWWNDPEFSGRLGACRELCDEFRSGSYRTVESVR